MIDLTKNLEEIDKGIDRIDRNNKQIQLLQLLFDIQIEQREIKREIKKLSRLLLEKGDK
ncbi:hypothetical protein ACFFIX_22390 [Metabacillus herbersteinensis]|uniref:Uncharacterized protein n=1 Tax=Metabacillus herbersteinensis TaxID=283816 RepID=A0ABV6GKZ7_9BACI